MAYNAKFIDKMYVEKTFYMLNILGNTDVLIWYKFAKTIQNLINYGVFEEQLKQNVKMLQTRKRIKFVQWFSQTYVW